MGAKNLRKSVSKQRNSDSAVSNGNGVVVLSSRKRRSLNGYQGSRMQVEFPRELPSVDFDSVLKQNPVLSKKEELELTGSVKEYMKIEKLQSKLEKQLGRQANLLECYHASNFQNFSDFKKAIKEGKRAQQKLVDSNFRLVAYWCQKYKYSGMDVQELLPVGIQGLMHGIELFDPNYSTQRLGQYAATWIRQYLQRCLMEEGRAIRLPVNYYEIHRKMQNMSSKLRKQLDRKPTMEELAKALKMDKERLEYIQSKFTSTRSIEVLYSTKKSNIAEELIPDNEECCDPSVRAKFNSMKKDVEKALSTLDPLQAQAIRLRYGLDASTEPLSLRQIAKIIKKSSETTRYLINNGLDDIRNGQMNYIMEYVEEATVTHTSADTKDTRKK
eukprot:TRINITY_DN3924_c0_g1_i4.p1 TRINITY_DN3924_c0_g1~~TRINITY_DN3924_c0_g1_i4.p1  ORF type:complete len:385 (-),score=63.73 TRINITY_DN3924_c0_g1_i4:209-1363(-)